MFDWGLTVYLLRHETADKDHYKKSTRHQCHLKTEGAVFTISAISVFVVGCGFMVGSPFQTVETLVKDLKFIEEFKPDMCGIGPFIPHKDTPFYEDSSGQCIAYGISRTDKAEHTPSRYNRKIDENGRERGIKAGANVVMPNSVPDLRAQEIRSLQRQAVYRRRSVLDALPLCNCPSDTK